MFARGVWPNYPIIKYVGLGNEFGFFRSFSPKLLRLLTPHDYNYVASPGTFRLVPS